MAMGKERNRQFTEDIDAPVSVTGNGNRWMTSLIQPFRYLVGELVQQAVYRVVMLVVEDGRSRLYYGEVNGQTDYNDRSCPGKN